MIYKSNTKGIAWMLGGILGILFCLLLLVLLYHTLNRVLNRVSMDYYFPFLKSAAWVEDSAAESMLMMKNKMELVRMVSILQQENGEHAANAMLTRQLEEENAQLRKLAGLQIRGRVVPVYAECILRDPVRWATTFTIDRGSQNGIAVGDPVLASTPIPGSREKSVTALIGKITAVSTRTATVSTLFSDEVTFSVSLPESKTFGVLQGDGVSRDSCVPIHFLPAQGRYAVGEVVLTSGFSQSIPSGLHVGRLDAFSGTGAAAQFSEGRLYANARLKPAVNMNLVRFVVVLSRRKEME